MICSRWHHAAAIAGGVLTAIAWSSVRADDEVAVTLDWIINGTHAGYFVAKDKGYYKDAGLDVTLSRGFGSGDTVKRVGSGVATLGVADTGAIIAARANEDIPVRIVAMVYQRATLGFIYLTESGIKVPKDLEGRKIGRSASGASVNMFPGFLKANGVDRSKIQEVVIDGATYLPMLMSRQVDAVLEQAVNAGRFKKMASQQGKTAVSMLYADFGLDTYGNALIANPKTMEAKPEVVRKFVEASLKGTAYAFAHPEEAIATVRRGNPELDNEAALDELTVMRTISITDDVRKTGLGTITADKMTATRDVTVSALSLKRTPNLDELYTTAFLPKTPVMPAN